MTTDPTQQPPGADEVPAPPEFHDASANGAPRLTRAGAAWAATAAALLLLVMLIVFILQNSTHVDVQYLGFSGTLPLGMALLIAAVGGGVLVAIAGVARVTQLRMNARRTRRRNTGG